MKHFINKGLLFIAAFVLIYLLDMKITTSLIIAMLISVAVSALYPALCQTSYGKPYPVCSDEGNSSGKKATYYMCQILVCIYLILGSTYHHLFLFASMVSYDMYRYKQKISPFIMVLSFAYLFFTTPGTLLLPEALLIIISIILSVYCYTIESLHYDILTLRDNTTEHDILVAENTRQLLENQDNMVLTATLSERNRIAREIHDNVGHMLTRSILQTGAIKIINKDDKLNKPLEQLQSTLDTAMDSMRKSVHDLHDESINLRLALEDIIKDVKGVGINLDYDMTEKLPKEIKYSFINIVKEAINNTLKHSNADHMDIRLREHPAFYQLYITDNGQKADNQTSPAATSPVDSFSGKTEGMGLYGIQERVNKLGGTLKISTEAGFSIMITIMKNAAN